MDDDEEEIEHEEIVVKIEDALVSQIEHTQFDEENFQDKNGYIF